MKEQLVCYKQMPLWNSHTLPQAFKEQHNTRVGTWAKLTIFKGSLEFALLNEQGLITKYYVLSSVDQAPLIEPQQWHKIISYSEDLQCQLFFYCKPEDYIQKKYGFTATHSEVIDAINYIKSGKALDLGCGCGRNALFLQLLGFQVKALDKNLATIQQLEEIIERDQLSNIEVAYYDINEAALQNKYNLIISTVVLMFLDRQRIPYIIENMQQSTLIEGYNLIVAAMSTSDFPCPMPFPFTFKENELKDYYQHWHIIKYNEDIGELHKTDEHGNRIKLRFATLLAQKKHHA